MIEKTAPQISLDLEARAEKAYSPQESSAHQSDDYNEDGNADLFQKKLRVENVIKSVFYYVAVVNSVYYHTVYLGNLHLEDVHRDKREKPEYQPRRVFQVITVDLFSENHLFLLCLSAKILLTLLKTDERKNPSALFKENADGYFIL